MLLYISHSHFPGSEAGILGALLGAGIFIFFTFIISIILYLLMAIGLYTMAKNENIENPWFAFIPILNLYTVGLLAGKVSLGELEIPRPELILPIGCLSLIILAWIPLIGNLLLLAYFIVYFTTLYYIYKKYSPDSAIILTVLSFFIPIILPIYFFVMRDKSPIVVAPATPSYQPPVYNSEPKEEVVDTPKANPTDDTKEE